MKSCCDDLGGLVTDDPDAKDDTFFREDGILMMVVKRVRLDDGVAYYERAVEYCPFCGSLLQTKESIAAKVKH